MVKHKSKFISLNFLKKYLKIQDKMLPSQTFIYILNANSFRNDRDFTAVLGYKDKANLAKHLDLKGKLHIKPVSILLPVY